MVEQKKENKVVRIRVESDLKLVEEVATLVSDLLDEAGYEIIEQSALYPNHIDPSLGRVFLTIR